MGKALTIAEIKTICKRLPTFIKMCENDLDEDEHKIKTPITATEYKQIERLLQKLNNCDNYVDSNIFK